MSTALLLSLLLFSASAGRTRLAQENGAGLIEGAVYDLYGAVIINVPISVENTATGEVINLRTDGSGRYGTKVQGGRYTVILRPSVGYPIGYRHSCFAISRGDKVVINFRPKPFSISDSIEGVHWIERYVGEFPSEATHFVQQNNGTIKDLRIQYHQLRVLDGNVEYKFSVIASFDRLTIYANRVVFYAKKGRLIAQGDVVLEDGERVRKARKAELNLLTGKSVVD